MPFCPLPYTFLEIRSSGYVHCCCWICTPVGNVFETDLDALWQGPVMRQIRESVTDGDFRYCARCPYLSAHRGPVGPTPPVLPDVSRIPSLWLSYDKTCNLSCPSCRPRVFAGGDVDAVKTDQLHDLILKSDVLKLADEITIAGYGEALASPRYRRLLQLLPALTPSARIHLYTNGQLLDEECWGELDLQRLSILDVSIDAATEATYLQNRRGGSWSRLWANIDRAAEKKRQYMFRLQSNYVIQANNFRELVPFVKMAFARGFDRVTANFIDDWQALERNDYLSRAAHLADHPYHAELCAVMRDPALEDSRVLLPSLPEQRHLP